MFDIHKYSKLLVLFLFLGSPVFIIHSQTGNHFVQNFLPKDYEAAANNSGMTQNAEGLIFVANNNGVLIYDGINWERVSRIGEPKIYSIAITPKNQVVVGTEDGDIAFVSKKKTGKYFYASLFDSLNQIERPIEIIRQIVNVNNNTYFLSADKLIEYDGLKLKAFKPKSSFHARVLVMGKHLFVSEIDAHISVLLNGKLVPIKGTEALASEKYFFCYPLSNNRYAIGFRNQGIYIAYYDSINPLNTRFERRESNCDTELNSALANNGCLLRNGNYVVTTNTKGAFELDTNLNIVRKYNIKNGIFDNNIKFAYEDINGNLWLALYYGISYVETNSRLFQYTRDNNIAGIVQSAAYFNNQLFIATDKGLQVYDTLDEKFKIFKDFGKQIWYLSSSNNRLFIGADKGLYVYEKNQINQLNENRTFFIKPDRYLKNILYVGTDDGLETYWVTDTKIENITTYKIGSEIKSIAQDASKNVYFVSGDHRIYFLNYNNSNILDSISSKYGLPEQEFETYIFPYKNRLLLGSDTGFYTISNDQSGNLKCIKDLEFFSRTKVSQIFRACQFGQDLISHQRYFNPERNKHEEKISLLTSDTISNNKGSVAFNHLNDVSPNSISNDTIRKIIFICSNEGLFILNSTAKYQTKKYNLIVNAFISNEDTLLEYANSEGLNNSLNLRIPYSKNNIRVVLGFTSFETSAIKFCYKLEGRDNEFSNWESENKITFNSLREGNYVLLIKALTDIEDKEYTLSIPFNITPPWYRSIYAYILYGILFLAFIYLVVKLNSKRLVELNRKLEQTIEERTSTISHQKEEIEHKQKEILDSINYAQRIQRALLASDTLLKDNMPEHFVFFQPKDVVSGDFYWAAVLANKRFALVTADSTGHGVPGAIMSMLNISCLKESVESEKLTSPKDILNHTRKKVIETLANDGSAEGGKDGMDCSLLCLDFKNSTFSYTAANNPVWVIRKDSNSGILDLIELSPDKMPVGKHDRDTVSFTEHEFQLQKNDVVYTLTDGLPDQFGGPKGKKFMYKKLKELLLSISPLPMSEQKSQIAQALEDWMGPNEQVDDICLIGVKI